MKLYSYRYAMGTPSPLGSPELDSPQTAVFVFGAPEFGDEKMIFAGLKNIYPKSIIIGCSGAGEIFGNRIYDRSLSISVARFERTRLKSAGVPIELAAQSFEAGCKLANELNSPDLTGIFVLSDGLKVNGSELARGINSVVGAGVIATGGLAGDGSRFQKTWVIHNGAPSSGYVTALAFYGNSVHIGHGSRGGWDIFGPERFVTKSSGNILYELDGKPALDMYKEYLGEKAAELPASALLFPLQIRSSHNSTRRLVRTILSVDEEQKAMVFAGDIKQGSLAQLMRANFDRLIEGASAAVQMVNDIETPQANCLALAISCVGRRLVLGQRSEEEVEATLERLPEGTQQIGFYSYGEISPYVRGEGCELHNQTMTLTVIYEKEAA